MREFQEKNRYKKILYSKTVVVVLAFLIIFFAHATWDVYSKQKLSAANVAEADKQLERLQNRETLLNSEITRLNTDEGIEEEIRSKFGVTKPGEHMVIVVDPNEATTAATTTPAQGWWASVQSWFK